MKVSLSLREEQSPLLRAKLPLNVLGMPLFTGFTTGDQQELALHLGTYFQAGPSFRLSYKPNDPHAAFSVLTKAGIGLWGSPNGAGLALSAEVNLSSEGLPSFAVRLKPRIGDFGLKKHTRPFTASYLMPNRIDHDMPVCSSEDYMTPGTTLGGKGKTGRSLSGYPHSKSSVSSLRVGATNGLHHAKDSGGVSADSGEFGNGKIEGSGNVGLAMSESFHGDNLKQTTDHMKNDDGYRVGYDDVDSDGDDSAAATLGEREIPWGVGSSAKGWSMSTHSRLPLGRWAEAKARWQVKFGSNLFHDLRHGLHITDVKLPSLSIDKICFQTLNSTRNSGSGVDLLGEGFGYPYLRRGDDSQQIGRIMDMYSTMRYQVHLLQLENNVLKSTLGEYRGDAGRRPSSKGSELMIQEDNALRSQLFDELNVKANNNSRIKDGNYNKSGFSKGDSLDFPRSDSGKTALSEFNSDPSEELKKAIMNASG